MYGRIQTIGTVVSSFPDKDLAAEIRLSPNDRFVYVSDRGANTMTIFLRNPRTGMLSIVEHVSAGGKFPVIRGQVIDGLTSKFQSTSSVWKM